MALDKCNTRERRYAKLAWQCLYADCKYTVAALFGLHVIVREPPPPCIPRLMSKPDLLNRSSIAQHTAGSHGPWKCRRQVEADERAELLSRRSTGGPLGWQRAGADEETALRGHVSNSKRILEEAYETGTAVLGNMAGQRERLKVSWLVVCSTWLAYSWHACLAMHACFLLQPAAADLWPHILAGAFGDRMQCLHVRLLSARCWTCSTQWGCLTHCCASLTAGTKWTGG